MKRQITLRGPVFIRDPCTSLDSTAGILAGLIQEEILPGVWNATVKKTNDPDWGLRVTKLTLRHESAPRRRAIEPIGSVFIDTGQCGVYDLDYFKTHHVDDDYDNPKSWYRQICDITELHNGLWGTKDDQCAVSSTGLGDGEYECYAAFDHNGNIVAIEIIYL